MTKFQAHSLGENSKVDSRWAKAQTKKAGRFPCPLFDFRLQINALALAELERLAGALATVFFSFFHAAISGEEAGIPKAPCHGVGGIFNNRFGPFGGNRWRCTGQTVHLFDCPGEALAHCASLAGTATALAERGQRTGLIGLDAHADVNTPQSSVSGNVHGMPVAHLLGFGHRPLRQLSTAVPAVSPEHLVYVGLRDLDDAERTMIRELGLHAYTMRDIDERGLRAVMDEAVSIATTGTGGVHVSCDADWVDPAEAPGVGTPVRGGATLREAHLAMEIVHDSGAMVAMDLVEINPILDRQNHTAELCAELIASAFGRRIL